MYRRSYTDAPEGLMIPDEYGGTTLSDEKAQSEENSLNMGASEHTDGESVSAGAFDVFGTQGLGKLFGSFKQNIPFLDKFGLEELLIIAVAAFLLFSKEKDIECALILIASLFIT